MRTKLLLKFQTRCPHLSPSVPPRPSPPSAAARLPGVLSVPAAAVPSGGSTSRLSSVLYRTVTLPAPSAPPRASSRRSQSGPRALPGTEEPDCCWPTEADSADVGMAGMYVRSTSRLSGPFMALIYSIYEEIFLQISLNMLSFMMPREPAQVHTSTHIYN